MLFPQNSSIDQYDMSNDLMEHMCYQQWKSVFDKGRTATPLPIPLLHLQRCAADILWTSGLMLIYLCLYGHCEPWPLFQFLNPIHSRYCDVFAPCGSCWNTETSKHARNNRGTSVYCPLLGNKQSNNEFAAVNTVTVAMQWFGKHVSTIEAKFSVRVARRLYNANLVIFGSQFSVGSDVKCRRCEKTLVRPEDFLSCNIWSDLKR
jgi:hypothetical protein